jgi:hypothetical protein
MRSISRFRPVRLLHVPRCCCTMSSDRREGPAQLAHPTEFDELLGRGYPNPDRVGCPPREMLVSLARRERPIGDPAYEHTRSASPVTL